MFDILAELKKRAVPYVVSKVEIDMGDDKKVVRAKVAWQEFDRYTGQTAPHFDIMGLDELKAHKVSLEARLAAINEALEVAEPKVTGI